ncbi:hypothetical protein BGZ49_009566 [Haplosporangium sp. Z 27]|nr:hypothetical protein BGZ49_009566 [Haplosporangium sp. Z 27]
MSQTPQPPPNPGGSGNPGARQSILRNPPTSNSQPDNPRMNSIIPIPEDEDDEVDDNLNEKEDVTPEQAYIESIGGRWGEGPSNVNVTDAQRDFRELERTMTALSRGQSFGAASATAPEQLRQRRPTGTGQEEAIRKEGDFDFETELKENILPAAAKKGLKMRTMGVSWSQLCVIGEGTTGQYIKTCGDPFIRALNLINPVHWFRRCTGRAESSERKTTLTIIHPMDGYCHEGEMILVLGRPGSDDFHYPILTVRETLQCAIRAKTPRARLPGITSRADFREKYIDLLTKMYGLTRQKETKVGNAFIRGLSGGERKRLSIAEQVATRSSINMWDGSTRGLDASSALDYVKSLRVSTNLLRRSTMVSIYQASENIYDLFDKVLVLYEGRCVYFGPADQARQYFIDLGFYCPARQTTADFLTAVTDPHERRPAEGLDPAAVAALPSTPEQFEAAYKRSSIYETSQRQFQEYQANVVNDPNAAQEFLDATAQVKQKRVSIKDPYTITYWNQIWGMTIRQVQLVKGDIGSLISRYVSMLIKAAIVGTTFLLLPKDTDGAFTRGGVLFFSLLFNSLIAQAELPATLMGRPILYKLKNYAMYRPSTFGLAQIVLDIPIILVHNLLFAFVVYFTSGLQRNARKFFIFVFILSLAALCMTSFFRAWGCFSRTFDYATKYSGVILLCLILYSGYLIPYQSMRGWFIWIFWVNPLAYAFKALISNEFHGLTLRCVDHSIVPRGPGFDNVAYQTCAIYGSTPGSLDVQGPDYLYSAYRYKTSQMWADIIAVICFWLLFTFLTVIIMEAKEFGKGGFSTNVFKRPKKGEARNGGRVAPDVEYGADAAMAAAGPGSKPVNEKPTEQVDMAQGSVFSWQDLDYVVPYASDPSGKKQLLTKIAGLVKPGTMTALMGSSGAGKTTLLDVLAQRKSMGWITGTIEVDGQPLRKDFQRTTGYCEQLDVHVPECTVREALQFSAYLRQPLEVSEKEKDEYVEEIIGILEMENIADALIGTTESGLGISVEERKRLTIGVELVAKPKLLFLDEPTSGLDAQASYHIMKFMRKLTDQGQAILCTIHQPSSQLFAFFDNLLLLAKGGRTVFFGELGHDSCKLISYFEKNGAPTCASDANPAEYILDVVNARHSDLDWPEIWNNSPEKTRLLEDIRVAHDSASSHHDPNEKELEYATPTRVQLHYVMKRMFRTYWRCPDYILDRLFMLTVFSLLNAFTFIQMGNKLVDVQSRIFVIFQILVMAPLLCNTVEPRFQTERQWFFREKAGKYYNWLPFGITIIVVEIPFMIGIGTVFFLILYWCVGFNGNSGAAIYTYVMVILFTIFSITLGQMIAAWTPSVQIAALLNPSIISILNLFCGVVMPYHQMPGFWRWWMYWVDPYTYMVEGLVTTQLNDVKITCGEKEYNIFNPPPGQTCYSYAKSFIDNDPGYINNPNDSSNCQYCPYSYGPQYFEPLNMFHVHRWRNTAIFCGYIGFNICFVLLGVRFFKGAKR